MASGPPGCLAMSAGIHRTHCAATTGALRRRLQCSGQSLADSVVAQHGETLLRRSTALCMVMETIINITRAWTLPTSIWPARSSLAKAAHGTRICRGTIAPMDVRRRMVKVADGSCSALKAGKSIVLPAFVVPSMSRMTRTRACTLSSVAHGLHMVDVDRSMHACKLRVHYCSHTL